MTTSFWKRTTSVPARLRTVAMGLAAGWAASACTTALNLSDYVFRTSESEGGAAREAGPEIDASGDRNADAGAPASADGGADAFASTTVGADASGDVFHCDVDLASQCYPCAPTAAIQLLNACTSASCVPFDDSTRVTRLLPDGALPPLPVQDAGKG